MQNIFRTVLIVALIVSLFANLFMYQRYRNRRVYMTVNKHSVTQQDIYDYLVQDKGPVVKLVLTERYMLDDEAKKHNLVPTAAEVQDRLNEERERNWQFARQMTTNPWMDEEYKNRFRQEIETARLLTNDIPVSEDQINEEYATRPQLYDTPAKAYCNLALLKSTSNLDNVKLLLEKGISPITIAGNYPNEVIFLGDNVLGTQSNIFIFFQPLGSQQNQAIFSLKPDEVKEMPPDEFAREGIAKLLVRMVKLEPGKKANLKDPKTHEKLRQAVAIKRSLPLQQYLMKLWGNTEFTSEDPNDKKYIERMLAPDHKSQ